MAEWQAAVFAPAQMLLVTGRSKARGCYVQLRPHLFADLALAGCASGGAASPSTSKGLRLRTSILRVGSLTSTYLYEYLYEYRNTAHSVHSP